jgi:hypothetical protein
MAEPIDAVDIRDNDILWRRVDRNMIDSNADGTESIQSFAFRDQNRELSMYLGRETSSTAVLASRMPEQVLIGIRVSAIRELGYKVVRDPEPGNAAHCIILPYPPRKDSKKMACASTRVSLDR